MITTWLWQFNGEIGPLTWTGTKEELIAAGVACEFMFHPTCGRTDGKSIGRTMTGSTKAMRKLADGGHAGGTKPPNWEIWDVRYEPEIDAKADDLWRWIAEAQGD